MNRLFSKLKDFGIIFSLETNGKENIVKTSKALKKADIPVALYNFDGKSEINAIKISNENEDMFLGALCPDNIDIMKKAMAAGAHFIVSREISRETIEQCRMNGYDLIVPVTSQEEIHLAVESDAEAIVINCNDHKSEDLICKAKEYDVTLFLSGQLENLPMELMRNVDQVCAFIIEDCFNPVGKELLEESHIIVKTNEIIYRLLELRYSNLRLTDDSPRTEEAGIFCALSSIPLFIGGDNDLLTMTTGDMDRTIAYLKWKNIYMDPLSAKMNGSKILETELYTEFHGWSVKLESRG